MDELIDKLELKLEHILESDTRTIMNPESENGWLFDRVYEALKIAKELERKICLQMCDKKQQEEQDTEDDMKG